MMEATKERVKNGIKSHALSKLRKYGFSDVSLFVMYVPLVRQRMRFQEEHKRRPLFFLAKFGALSRRSRPYKELSGESEQNNLH